MPPRPILMVPASFTTTVPIEYEEEQDMADHDYWYLENREAGHSKFYEVEIVANGATFNINTRHGKIGTKGRSLSPHVGLKTINSARNTAQSIAEGKVAKGYKLVRNTHPSGKKTEHYTAPKPAAGRFGRLMLED